VVLGTPFLVSVRHCLRLVDAFNEIGLLGAGNTENTSMTKKENDVMIPFRWTEKTAR
jgi:hypothetical protein